MAGLCSLTPKPEVPETTKGVDAPGICCPATGIPAPATVVRGDPSGAASLIIVVATLVCP